MAARLKRLEEEHVLDAGWWRQLRQRQRNGQPRVKDGPQPISLPREF